jgi:hypothetical protein
MSRLPEHWLLDDLMSAQEDQPDLYELPWP